MMALAALIVALVFWFSLGLTLWAVRTRLRLGRDRQHHRLRTWHD